MTPAELDCERTCDPACPTVFDRVVVRLNTAGGTRVMWELLPTFTDPAPLTFQLQLGPTASHDSLAWVDVGAPRVNSYYAIDTEQRVFSVERDYFYRVKLTTVNGVYYSEPTHGLGILTKQEWRIANDLIRQQLLAYRAGYSAQEGYLLKLRRTGEPCPRCVDRQSQDVLDSQCPVCYGTGYRCGYYYPISCVWADLTQKKLAVALNDQIGGTDANVAVMAKMLGTTLVQSEDMWVSKRTDDRYVVKSVANTVEVRGVPIICVAELRMLRYSSILYKIPIPENLLELTL